jgi:hypothetical protein
MATTTNYGWTTPDDTALVKDGAAAIRTLGTSVDTTTKNLNPSTTLGDIEYRSSTANVNTRLPLGTAGQVLKVNSGATAPEWATDASGMTNPMTTTGDTIYSSSGSTPARLGIGSTGQILTVAAGVPSWATPGGSTKSYSLLSTTSLSGASTTISSLSGYDNFFILIRGASSTVASRSLVMQINAIGTPSNYREMGGRTIAQSTYSAAGLLTEIDYFENNGQLYIGKMGNNVSSTISGFIQIAGANTSGTKVLNYGTTGSDGGGSLNAMSLLGSISKDTAVVSSLKFYFDSGDLDAGTVYIYGAA